MLPETLSYQQPLSPAPELKAPALSPQSLPSSQLPQFDATTVDSPTSPLARSLSDMNQSSYEYVLDQPSPKSQPLELRFPSILTRNTPLMAAPIPRNLILIWRVSYSSHRQVQLTLSPCRSRLLFISTLIHKISPIVCC